EADDLTGINEFTDLAETNLVNQFFNLPLLAGGITDSVGLINIGKQLLGRATTRFVYDFDVYKKTGKPIVIATINREEHFQKNNNSPIQIGFEYSDGLGNIALKKLQAEPGMAKTVVINPDNSCVITEVDTDASNPKQLRWVGSGRTILNNKGNAVKQYEPYFSTTFEFEGEDVLVEIGFSSVLYYDPLSRNIRVEHANGTLSKTEFDAWKQLVYDENDTVLESQWYVDRGSPNPAGAEPLDPEQRAAWLAAKHANTPSQQHFDSLGRTVYSIADNGVAGKYATRSVLDIENNLLEVIDARGNIVMEYKYDMISHQLYQNSMDGGE